MRGVRIGFAVVVMVAFLSFALFLVLNADTQNQDEWERWVYVFGGIEAPAFTAIGWVFGREVHRERAEKAEERAKDAEAEKATARAKGHKLAGMVVGAAGVGGGGEGRRRMESAGTEAGGLDAAVAYARNAFGE